MEHGGVGVAVRFEPVGLVGPLSLIRSGVGEGLTKHELGLVEAPTRGDELIRGLWN
jgi:hypothetical protein